MDLSPTSIIRRSYFPCNPIPRNADCSERDLHAEVHYDLLDFSQDPELRDSMLLVQQYSLEPFMTLRQFFYPQVVIELYHTITSRREPNPTAFHFSIDGRPRILRASDITATYNLLMVLANSAAYRHWPHPSPKEMVRFLSGDTIAGTILFRRQLPLCMHLIEHILRFNLFPHQHIVQRRGAILEALYRISEGFWFSPAELIMTSLFHFEDKVHRRSLPRAESTPLLFPRLLCQVLEHIGFPEEPRLERRRDCEAVLIIDQWHTMPCSYHLPPPDPAEDQPATNIPPEDQPPTAEPIEEPQAPAPLAPATTAPIPLAPVLSHPVSRSDPNGGSELSLGRETIYWDSLPVFFFRAELVPVGI